MEESGGFFNDYSNDDIIYNYSDYSAYEYNGDDSIDHYTTAITFLKDIFPLIHLVIALLGNTVSTYIMWKMTSSVTLLCAYPMVLGITDSLFLATDMMTEGKWPAPVSSVKFWEIMIARSDTLCKSYTFARNFLSTFSSWVVVCLGIETYRTTKVPTRWKNFKKMRIVDTLVLLTATLSILNVHYFWTWGRHSLEIIGNMNYVTCTFGAKTLQGHYEGKGMQDLLVQIHFIASHILPTVAVSVTILMLIHVRNKYKVVCAHDSKHGNTGQTYGKHILYRELRDKTFAILLGMFVAFHLPYVAIKELNIQTVVVMSEDPTGAKWMMISTAIQAWASLNASYKFVLYALTCQQFRTELRMFGSRIKTWLVGHMDSRKKPPRSDGVTLV